MIKKLLILVTITISAQYAGAQHFFLPLSNETMQKYDPWLNRVDATTHTSIKPYLAKDLYRDTPYDSLTNYTLKDTKFNHRWIGRKLFSEHFLQVKEDDVTIHVDPAFEVSGGRDLAADSSANFFINSRGIYIEGTIGKGFSFNASFYENQATFPYYLDSVVAQSKIVPGQGRIKRKINQSDPYDFSVATGTISYQLNKHFTFQFGHDRNFIGDGYRSLFLSDNSSPYPFLKIVTDFWKIRYMNIFAVMQDLEALDDPKWDDATFKRKYGSFHYLDVNIGKHATIGLFEAVIWKSDSLKGYRTFDFNYANPFVFFRPVENGIGSPDNVLLGINMKFKLNSNNQLYGQIMLDEFVLDNVTAGTGWSNNKQGLMGGFKSYNLFGVKNLHIRSEFSYVRPYSYQHREPLGNYGHYRQPLAHPLGANFIESVNFIYYTHKRFDATARLSYVKTGFDSTGQNYGQNIYYSYVQDIPHKYGNRVAQGLATTIIISQLTLSYTINPSYNLRFFVDVMARQSDNVQQTHNTLTVQAGLKTYLFNRYYDF
ncbi:MAG: hypothetical protein ABI772_09725 [Bacteroidota bacterium]